MSHWFYNDGSKSVGPVSAYELRELAASGGITPATLVSPNGRGDWVPASTVKELTFVRAPKAVPPPFPTAKSPPIASPIALGSKLPNVPSKQGLSIFAWTLIGIGSACAFGVAATVTWNLVRPRTIIEEFAHTQTLSKSEADQAKREAENRLHIRECTWWSKKPTDADLDRFIDLIVSTNAGNYVFIDDLTRTLVADQYDIDRYKEHRSSHPLLANSDLRRRRFDILVAGSRRITKQEALAELRAAVDRAEFKGGPAPASPDFAAINWQRFSHPTGVASIDMPGVAILAPNANPDPSAKVYNCDAQDFICSLMTTELPALSVKQIADNPAAVDEVFLERKKRIINVNTSATVISETRIHDAGANCVEMRMGINGGIIVSRCYVKGPYMIVSAIFFTPETDIVKEQRDRFFDSLKLADVPIAEKPTTTPTGPGVVTAVLNVPVHAVTKGSFSAWTDPRHPEPGIAYHIVIQIRLPPDVKTYRGSDLTGMVVGSDGYKQAIRLSRTEALPVRDGVVQVRIRVPGAAKLVRDTIRIESKVLIEEQVLEIEFSDPAPVQPVLIADPDKGATANPSGAWKPFDWTHMAATEDMRKSSINGPKYVLTIDGRDFGTMLENGPWSAISFDLMVKTKLPTLFLSVNGVGLELGKNIEAGNLTRINVVHLQSAQKIICLLDGKPVASAAATAKMSEKLMLKIALKQPAKATIELRDARVFTGSNPPAELLNRIGISDAAVAKPIPTEFREFFERADATTAELVSGIDKKIAGLEKAIGDIDTLPVDKKRMEQELLLVRAKLASLNRAKPVAFLRNNPVIGDLGTLQTARVVAVHDIQSVVASVADIYGARLTDVNTKSLKMKVGVTIDEDAVWQVVAVDETPSAAVADSLKAKKLVVVKLVDKNELEKHRAAYEAAVKPSPITPAQ